MADPGESEWAKARELCRALSEEFDPAEHRADATKCYWCCQCAAALAEASDKGRQAHNAEIGAALGCHPGNVLYEIARLRANRVKCLLWDGSGLWVCTKRIEQGTLDSSS